MSSQHSEYKNFFSDLNLKNFTSIEDLDLEITTNDNDSERKIKKILEKVKSIDKQRKNNPQDINQELTQQEHELTEEANILMDELIDNGTISLDSFANIIAETMSEITSFMEHEPDHIHHFSDDEKKMIAQEVYGEIEKRGVNLSDQELDELLSKTLQQAQDIISKLRSPRF